MADEVGHIHQPLAPGLYGRITCADTDCTLDVRWAPTEERPDPPDFGKSGMRSWTDRIAPDC